MWSVYDEREEGRDIGEHTGQDEWVFGVVVQHGLQQLHALVYRQLLHSEEGHRDLTSVSQAVIPHTVLLLVAPLKTACYLNFKAFDNLRHHALHEDGHRIPLDHRWRQEGAESLCSLS